MQPPVYFSSWESWESIGWECLEMEAGVCHLNGGSTADKLCWQKEEEMEREDK